MAIRWIVEGGLFWRDVVRWWRNCVKGEVVGGVVKLRFGGEERGMKWMGEGEGRISRLERSKSWQKIAVSLVEEVFECGMFLSGKWY